MSFLHIDMTQVVEILPRVWQGSAYSTYSISWLLMSWRRKEPDEMISFFWAPMNEASYHFSTESGLYVDACKHIYMCWLVCVSVCVCGGGGGGGGGGGTWLQIALVLRLPCTSLSIMHVQCNAVLTRSILSSPMRVRCGVSVAILRFDLISVAVITVPIVVSCKLDCVMEALDCMYIHVVCWIHT